MANGLLLSRPQWPAFSLSDFRGLVVSKKFLIISCLIAFAVGYNVSSAVNKPKDRPVLKALARFAKTALWLAAFAEPAPEAHEEAKSTVMGEDGYVQVNHARGW